MRLTFLTNLKAAMTSWLASSIRGLSGNRALTNRRQRNRSMATLGIIQSLEPRRMLSGQSLLVTTLEDVSSQGHVTLRDAINQANGDTSNSYTISFDPNLFAGNTPGTIKLDPAQGALTITSSMTITGPGAGLLTISAQGNSQVFVVDDGNASVADQVMITGLTLSDGFANGSTTQTQSGGAIYNAESLTLSNDVLSNNTSGQAGGAVENVGTLKSNNDTFSSNNAVSGGGGAIDNSGTLASTSDTFSQNTANNGGGVFNTGTMTTNSDTYSSNTGNSVGGGVDNEATLTSTNDTYSGNTGVLKGGGIYSNIPTSSTTAVNDTIAGNFGPGGGIDNEAGTWNLMNTVVAGNFTDSTHVTPSDIVNNGTSITAQNTLVGDANSAGGIIDGITGNIVGSAVNSIFVTGNGLPLLADNGGPTQTIALNAGSPAIGAGAALDTLDPTGLDGVSTTLNVTTGTYLAVGDTLQIGSEKVLVTAGSGTSFTISRGQAGTFAAPHAGGSPIILAYDQRGNSRSGSEDIGSFALQHPARTLTVNSLLDVQQPGLTTLRDAVTMANADASGDTINFDPTLFANGTATINLTQGALLITKSMTINGPGADMLTVSGNNESQIFVIDDGNNSILDQVAITGLTLTQGTAIGTSVDTQNGGAIFNAESLTLSKDVITGNLALGNQGGGVYNQGVLTSSENVFSQNSSFNGGALSNQGEMSSTKDTFSGNSAIDGAGGGLFNQGSLNTTSDTFSQNSAPFGGGLANLGEMASTNDSFVGNQAMQSTYGGGGVYNDASAVLQVTNDTFSTNQAKYGGGLSNYGTVISNRSTYSSNTATVDGGGLVNDTAGKMSSTNDTFSGNSANGNGGGIDNFAGTLTTTDDTIAGNSANGGGVYNNNLGQWNSLNTIVAGNLLASGSTTASDVVNGGGTITASYTLIGDVNSSGGILNGSNNNIVGQATAAIFQTDTNGNPLLKDNRGATQTIALAAGSPAINMGGALTSLSAAVANATATTFTVNDTTYLSAGDSLRIDKEIVVVSSVNATQSQITVVRGANATSHLLNASVTMAKDQRGFVRGLNDIGSYAAVRTIVVNSLNDVDTPGKTTLRNAIDAANVEGPGDTITFDPQLFANNTPGTIVLNSELTIVNSMTITGPGANLLTISGNSNSQIFVIDDGSISLTEQVAITGLKLMDGAANGNLFDTQNGGAIFNAESLVISNDQFVNNSSFGGNGGGALANTGSVTSTNDTFTGNTSISYGGGINNQGILTSTGDIYSNNTAQIGGGGLSNFGTLTLQKARITTNTASSSNGGGVYNDTQGVFNAISDTFSNNSAVSGGGVENLGTVNSYSNTYSGNTADASSGGVGGGIDNESLLSSTNDTFSGNSAGDGGGIYSSGTLTTTNDTVAGNFGNAGGVSNHAGTWNSLNTIVAGNMVEANSSTASDIANKSGGTVTASNTLVGDANSAGGIVDGTFGNIVGRQKKLIFQTDANGNPVLANNGGPTQTIALAIGSPAINAGAALTVLSAALDSNSTTMTVADPTYLAIGDLVRIDNEILVVTSIDTGTNQIGVQRGQHGTTAASHASNAPVTLAMDERGFVRGLNDMGAFSAPRTLVVDTLSDTDIPGFTTLRDAISVANAESSGDIITFAPSLFASNTPQTITLTQGALTISNSMSIAGPGASKLTVSGNNISQIFIVDDGNDSFNDTVLISGLTLSGGNAHGTTFETKNGGAIYNAESLTLKNDLFSSNTAIGESQGGGGAVENFGILTSSNNTFTGNSVTISNTGGGGGAIDNENTLVSSNDTFANNMANFGGGILNSGTLTTYGDTFSVNTASNTSQTPGLGNGGGIDNEGTLSSTNDTYVGNMASSGLGGGIYNSATNLLTTTNDTITGNVGNGGGVNNAGGTWNSMNTIVAGNRKTASAVSTPSDVVNTGGTITAGFTMIGDKNSTGGIVASPTNGNIIGVAVNAIFQTDANGNPLLANNGGPTQTVLLSTGSRAINVGGPLTSLASAVSSTTSTTFSVSNVTFLAVGDCLRIGTEIVTVTDINAVANQITVLRGQMGTSAAPHTVNSLVNLAKDQRGYVRGLNDIGSTSVSRTIVVTILGDTNVPGQTTLRNAVNAANVESPGDVITFAPSLFASNTMQTITLTGGPLLISNSMTITGPGANLLTISGNNDSQIFIVDDHNATVIDQVAITGLTLTQGIANGTTNDTQNGGAVFNAENLTLSNDVISNSTALLADHGNGGGVFNAGILTSKNDTFMGNSGFTGGGLDNVGNLISLNDTFSGNNAYHGGGLGNEGIAITTNDTFAGNTASFGSGIMNDFQGVLATTNDTVAGNFGSGGVYVNDSAVWNALNTIVAGNLAASGSNTHSDVVKNAGTINSYRTLIGDAGSAGGIVANAANGDIVGVATNAIFVTDANGNPLLADNGGLTQTIALNTGSPAIGYGGSLASLSGPILASSATIGVNATTFLAVGDCLQIDNEIVVVTAVNSNLNQITVLRGQFGSIAVSHSVNATLTLAYDERGVVRGASNELGSVAFKAPVSVNAPLKVSINENSSLIFAKGSPLGISLNDVKLPSGVDSVTLSVSHGTLTLGSTTGLTFATGKNGSSSMTVTGSLANLNLALCNLVYTPASGYIGADKLAVSITNTKANVTGSTNVAITVNALPPTIAAPVAVSVSQNGTLSFSNPNTITVADVNGTSEQMTLLVLHGNLLLGSTTGLTVAGNGTANITVSGSLSALNAALSTLVYTPTSGYFGADTLCLVDTDTAIMATSVKTLVSINVTQLPPVVTVPTTTVNIIVNTITLLTDATGSTDAKGMKIPGPGISVSDINGVNEQMTLTVLHGTLTFSPTIGLNVTSSGNGTASVTLTGNLSVLNTVLATLKYTPRANYIGPDTLTVTDTNTNNNLSTTKIIALNVGATPPVITAPKSIFVNENASLLLNGGNAIVVSDNVISSEQMTLTVLNGTLKLGTTTGLTSLTGNGTSTLSFSGSLSNINADLATLVYSPTNAYHGADTLTLKLQNATNNQIGTSVVPITVNSLPPTILAPKSVSLSGTTKFAGSNAIILQDLGGTAELMKLTVAHGTLNFTSTAGLTSVTGNNTGSVTIIGSLDKVNAALATLCYTPASGFLGTDTLAISDVDTVSNLAAANTKVSITVTAPPPVLNVPASLTTNMTTTVSFTGANAISVADGNATAETFTLTVLHGNLSFGSTSGLTKVTGNSTGSVTVTGSLVSLNAALATLSYTPTAGYHGSDLLTLSDTNNTNNLTSTATVGITVTAVPPAITAPTSLNKNANVDLLFTAGNSIQVSDPSATTVQLKLTVLHGNLTFVTTTGLSVAGNGTGTVTLTGALTNINAALATLRYTSVSYFGPETLNLTATNTNNNLMSTANVSINVIAVAPTITSPNTLTTTQNTTLFLTNSNAISIADSSGTAEKLTISVSHGILKLAKTIGLTITGNGTGTVTISGSLAALNAALATLAYTPTLNYKGADILVVSALNTSDNLVSTKNIALTVV